jgi:hypothetical protein
MGAREGLLFVGGGFGVEGGGFVFSSPPPPQPIRMDTGRMGIRIRNELRMKMSSELKEGNRKKSMYVVELREKLALK